MVDVAAFQGDESPQRRLCVLLKNIKLHQTSHNEAYTETLLERLSPFRRVMWKRDLDYDLCLPKEPHDLLETVEARKQQEEKLLLLNETARAYISDCQRHLSAGEVKPRYSQYYDWMIDLTARYQTSSSSAQARIEEPPAEDASVESTLLSRIGTNLSSILTGHLEPLSLLFEDDILFRFYAEDTASCRCYVQMVQLVQRLALKKRLRILEIGAGTGGATLPLLKTLDSSSSCWPIQYDFTDVSSGFFDKAQQRLEKWKQFLRFKVLDVDRSAAEQGFQEESYDLVLASNALHTASNLDTAISNARRLLVTGGRLVLIEYTQLPDFVNAFTGLLTGWYLNRADGRKGAPTLSRDQWHDRLSQDFFSGVDFETRDFEGPAHAMSMLVTRAIPRQPLDIVQSPIHIVFDCDEASSTAQALQKLLQEDQLSAPVGKAIALPLTHSTDITLSHGSRPTLSISEPQGKPHSHSQDGTRVLWISVLQCYMRDLARGLHDLTYQPEIEYHPATVVKVYVVDESPSDMFARRIHKVLVESYLAVETQQPSESHYLLRNGGVFFPRLSSNSHCDTAEKQEMNRTDSVPSQATKISNSGSEQVPDKNALLSARGTYVIISDWEAQNDEMCCFLSDRGARRILVLTSGLTPCVREWKTNCVRVFYQVFTSSLELGEMLQNELADMPPVEGIMYLRRHYNTAIVSSPRHRA
ncbi:MAG: hypothetical protein Q9226_008872 [Calogaya cf. arnoldii]